MKKRFFIGLIIPLFPLFIYCQDYSGERRDIRIGAFEDVGDLNVPLGAITKQLNIDFSGYRDVQRDQIGARIAAIRYNIYQSNRALVHNTALVFYTNPLGQLAGTAGLIEQMRISPHGNVGIGTDNPKNKLDVAGTIRATEVRIEALPWSDFVFNKDYKLRSLEEVKAHIDEYKHLPDIPSEAEVTENGISLGTMQSKLLQKIEELTLYLIEQNVRIEELEKENVRIKQEINKP